jgi:hypothetical protein
MNGLKKELEEKSGKKVVSKENFKNLIGNNEISDANND